MGAIGGHRPRPAQRLPRPDERLPGARLFANAGGSLMPRAPVFSPHVNGLIEYMVETAGSRKVGFGSDLPWYSQHYHAGAVLFAHISDEARHDILHRNAEQ